VQAAILSVRFQNKPFDVIDCAPYALMLKSAHGTTAAEPTSADDAMDETQVRGEGPLCRGMGTQD
jgi:hypothetical protein